MRPLADFSEEIFQVRQEWNDTGKALIKKRKKEKNSFTKQKQTHRLREQTYGLPGVRGKDEEKG